VQLGMANGQGRTLRAKGYVRHLDRQIRRTIPVPTCRIMRHEPADCCTEGQCNSGAEPTRFALKGVLHRTGPNLLTSLAEIDRWKD